MKSLAIVLFVCIGALQSTASDEIPNVRLDYHYVPFDRMTEDLTDTKIETEAIEELKSRQKEFQKAWDAQGPDLLKAVVRNTGRPFQQNVVKVTLTLSKFRSMSHPLLLNMRPFMTSITPEEKRLSKAMFVAIVFHELLHHFVSDNLGDSPLLEKYTYEPGSVRAHLHLNALLKDAYLALGKEKDLAEVIAKDIALPRPVYKRAWHIVNDIEGHRAFLAEFNRSQVREDDRMDSR